MATCFDILRGEINDCDNMSEGPEYEACVAAALERSLTCVDPPPPVIIESQYPRRRRQVRLGEPFRRRQSADEPSSQPTTDGPEGCACGPDEVGVQVEDHCECHPRDPFVAGFGFGIGGTEEFISGLSASTETLADIRGLVDFGLPQSFVISFDAGF